MWMNQRPIAWMVMLSISYSVDSKKGKWKDVVVLSTAGGRSFPLPLLFSFLLSWLLSLFLLFLSF